MEGDLKAIISNRIYLDANQGLMEKLSAALTYTIPSPTPRRLPEILKTFNRINSRVCSIPVGRLDLIPPEYEIIDKRALVPVEFPEFKFSLRESQQLVYNAVKDNTILNAPVSWGKTFTAIALAKKLGQKTLIIAHNTMLRDQWIAEVEKTLNIEAGIIGSSKLNIDPIIVVGNVQSVTKKAKEIAETFGTVILDEMHHVSADTFSEIIDKSRARYKIGLSGTLIRKDKKHVIFNDYFGFNTIKPEKENYMEPTVVIAETEITLPPGRAWAARITALEVYNPGYQDLIVALADSAAKKGHKVLVVGSRVDFLKTCTSKTTQPSTAITGETVFSERTRLLSLLDTEKLNIIFGTMSIFSEGISQNSLSCLILATPINNESLLTQLIGRVCRLKEGKPAPLVIDINLKGTTARTQQQIRVKHYIENGYTIKRLKK